MQFKMVHYNFNVLDVGRSILFYQEAFGLKELRRNVRPSFIIVYLQDESGSFLLELTQLFTRSKPYDLGDNEMHLAFQVDDYDEAYQKHKAMGIICYENPEMGIYFVSDPDGYWLEVIPERRR